LIFLPRWRYSAGLISSVIIPSMLAVVYLVLVLPRVALLFDSYSSMDSMIELMQNPAVFVVAWVHYLAFDLFIGAWIVRDAQRLGLYHMAVIPSLFLTFAFGPIGLLVYYQLRWYWGRRVVIDEGADGAAVSG
jgi:hypothetical protein